MTKYYLNKRKWLNPIRHEDSGAVHYSVYNGDYGWVDADLTIWDCSRKITLNLGFSNPTEAKQRAIKINSLIKALEEMKKAMGEAYEDVCNYREETE